MVIVAAGRAVAVWVRLTIGRNWSGNVTMKESHELVQRGPYALVRNPTYTGLGTMLVGSILLTGFTTLVIALVVVAFAFFFKFRTEEELMSEASPGQYPEYRRRVTAIIAFAV